MFDWVLHKPLKRVFANGISCSKLIIATREQGVNVNFEHVIVGWIVHGVNMIF